MHNFSGIHYRHMFLSNNSCFLAQEIFDNRKKKSKYRISRFIKGHVIYASTCNFKYLNSRMKHVFSYAYKKFKYHILQLNKCNTIMKQCLLQSGKKKIWYELEKLLGKLKRAKKSKTMDDVS